MKLSNIHMKEAVGKLDVFNHSGLICTSVHVQMD